MKKNFSKPKNLGAYIRDYDIIRIQKSYIHSRLSNE